MKAYFITATGTGVGKTLFTSALAWQLRERKINVRALKPVVSGFDADHAAESDVGSLLAAQGLPLAQECIDSVSPWHFAAPLSPDMAAADEVRVVGLGRLVEFCRRQNAEYLLIEAAGGVMTPLNAEHTMLDWAQELGHPVILVAGSYLGTLSHTLTSAHAITNAGLMLHAVVVCESEISPVPPKRALAALKRFLPPTTRTHLISRLDSSPQLWKYVPDLTASVL